MSEPALPTASASRPIEASPRLAAAPDLGMDRQIGRSRWRRSRGWVLSGAGLLALGAVAASFTLVPSAGTLSVPSEEITTSPAQNLPFRDYLPLRATVAPLHTVFVGAIQGGTVERVVAQDGATVAGDDVLAMLSNPQLQLDVTAREATIAGQLGAVSAQRLSLQQNLTNQDDAVAAASYNLLKARRELAIRERLRGQGFESDAGVSSFQDEAHYDASRLATLQAARLRDVAVAIRQKDEIDETAATLQNTLREVRGSLQALTLRAPVAGRLTNFSLQPGQNLRQGDAIGQIDSIDRYRLDADIDEFYLGRVAEGQQADADLDGSQARLTVARVRPQVTNGQFRAELTFDHAPPIGLRRGESVETRITLGRTRSALVLPNGPWLEASGGSFVFVMDATGQHAVRRAIVSGRRNPEQVEITSGISAGERVITSTYARYQAFSRLLVQARTAP